MESSTEAKTASPHRSPWFLVGLSVLLALLTLYGFSLYSMVHALGFHSTALVMALDQVKIEPDARGLSEAKGFAKELHEGVLKLLLRSSAYRFLGLVSVLLAIWSIFRRPRWACLLAFIPAACAAFVSIAMQ